MIGLNKIDNYINSLLDNLQSIQNKDGSFDTMYLQPYYNPDKGWMKFPVNAPYDLACCLIPLLTVKSEKSKLVIEKGKEFILAKAFEKKLWSYPILSDEYLHFYDTDSTALCSFVLEQTHCFVANKNLLNQFIQGTDYNVFIVPHKPVKQLSIVGFIKLLMHNKKVKKGRAWTNNLMRADDQDFIVTCNNLLYIGETEANRNVWKATKDKFFSKQLSYSYYPTLYHCLYFYARLCAFSKHQTMIPDDNTLQHYIIELYPNLKVEDSPMHRILLMNGLLFMDKNLNEHESLIENCLKDISKELFKESYPLYSGNIHTDRQTGTNLPNTYFGSPAITCSLYIEFLNLYRKRFYGSYYGQD